jgi:hypothetical protein
MSNEEKIFRVDSMTEKLFEERDAKVILLRSSVGSGKSSGAIMKAAKFCLEVCPPKPDGSPRQARVLVVRQDQAKLRSTFLKTFEMWMGEVSREVTQMTYPIVIRDIPFVGEVDGEIRTVLIEWVLMGIANQEEADTKLRSFEATCSIIEEIQTYPTQQIINDIFPRLGRFPAPDRDKRGDTLKTGYTGQRMIICPFNPPSTDHWLYKVEMGDKKHIPDGWKFLAYPPAILPITDPDGKWTGFKSNPEADYAQNQPSGYDYWIDQAKQLLHQPNGQRRISVDLMGNYGSSYSGKPVYEEWDDAKHMTKNALSAKSGRTFVGFDHSGVNPAIVVVQPGDAGYYAIKEMGGEEMVIEDFVEDIFMHWLHNNSQIEKKDIIFCLDPADARDRSGGTTHKMLMKKGFKCVYPRNNRPEDRISTVKRALNMMALRVNPECEILVEGMRGRYAREKIRGTDTYKALPDPHKNHPFSDIQDALAYAMSVIYQGYGRAAQDRPSQQRDSYSGSRLV